MIRDLFFILTGVVAFGKTVISRDAFVKKSRREVDTHAHRRKAMITNLVQIRVAEHFAQACKPYFEALEYCSRMTQSKWTLEVVRRPGPVQGRAIAPAKTKASAKAKADAKAKARANSNACVSGEISSVMEAFRFVKSLRRFQQRNSFRLVQTRN